MQRIAGNEGMRTGIASLKTASLSTASSRNASYIAYDYRGQGTLAGLHVLL